MAQRPPNASAIIHIMQYMTYSLHGDEHGDKNSYILGIQLAFPFVSIFHLGTSRRFGTILLQGSNGLLKNERRQDVET